MSACNYQSGFSRLIAIDGRLREIAPGNETVASIWYAWASGAADADTAAGHLERLQAALIRGHRDA